MYIPGSRTLRRLATNVLRPTFEAANAIGATRAATGLRRTLVRRYLQSERYEQATRGALGPAMEWARISVDASEASGYFFSKNLVSNESESLLAAPLLQALPAGLAYIGVGPETMLSYLGLVESPLAFVVDIRRDNTRLHYLYRGAFSEARSRTEWLSLLLGRPYIPAMDIGPEASIRDILSAVAATRPTEASFEAAHVRIMGALDRLPPVLLPFDRRAMRQIHRHFWRLGLDITFQQEGLRLRRYPTLASLLSGATSDGQQVGFLANESVFRRISRLENGNGVIPVVGDICGTVLERITTEIDRRGLSVGAIYISNVEQYLFEHGQWNAWVNSLRKLPCHRKAILIRSYFQNEQGPAPDPPPSLYGQLWRTIDVAMQVRRNREPLAMHQMKTVVHNHRAFLEREARQRYASFRELVCDDSIAL